MNLTKQLLKLKENKMTNSEYQQFKTECMKMIEKIGNKYHFRKLVFKPIDIERIKNDVYIKALLKTLKYLNIKKGSFSTYFYYKVRSAFVVELAKYKRRYKILNTDELYSNYNYTETNKQKHKKINRKNI